MIDLQAYLDVADETDRCERYGRVLQIIGLSVTASGPALPVGSLVSISAQAGDKLAVVVGFKEDSISLQPFDGIAGLPW